MTKQTRTQVQQDKERFVKRFYKDWKKYSREYVYHPESSNVKHYVDEYDSAVLVWRSPQVMKYQGKLSDKNLLIVSLMHPDESKGQLIFSVKIQMHFDTKLYSEASREIQCIVNPALNLHTSVITAKLLLAMSSIIGQNKLESSVSRAVIAIINSIQAGELTVSSELYSWNNYYQHDVEVV